jgi:site-specific recombinase XerD
MTQAITPLRQRMIEDVRLRNFTQGTQKAYVRAVANYSLYHSRSPDHLGYDDVRDYQLHLVARGLKASTISQIMCALRFFY